MEPEFKKALIIVFPLVVGLCITTPLLLIRDLIGLDDDLLLGMPMMIGAGLSATLAFKSAYQTEKELRKEQPKRSPEEINGYILAAGVLIIIGCALFGNVMTVTTDNPPEELQRINSIGEMVFQYGLPTGIAVFAYGIIRMIQAKPEETKV